MLSMFALAALIDSLPTTQTIEEASVIRNGAGEFVGVSTKIVEIAGPVIATVTSVTVESWRNGKRVARRDEWEIAISGVEGTRRIRKDAGCTLASRAVARVIPATYRKVNVKIVESAARFEQTEV